LPERGSRAVAGTSGNGNVTVVPASEKTAGASTARVPTSQAVKASTASAEYIPARRDQDQPVYGRANQALASYQATSSIPVDSDADTVVGIDLYA
jgi:hypothetical protein